MQVDVKSVLLFFLFLVAFGLWVPLEFLNVESERFLLIIGIVAAWRYGWLGLNVLRSIFYKKVYYPRIRKAADQLSKEDLPKHAFIIVTTYRIPEDISKDVYRGAIEEAKNLANHGIEVTLIASIVEKAEENFVKEIWGALSPPPNTTLIINRFAGTGKRDGLAVAFRTMLRRPAKLKDSIVALVDGDTILTKDSILKSAPLFKLFPKLGALTTNEDNILEEKDLSHKIYNRWFKLRFAQRDIYMSSASLSRRVMTLTGRMSIYRGELFYDPEFVDTVQHDYIEHWRLGWFRFLTGDDKSTWFYVLKNGWEMLYLPDIMVYTREDPPHKSFIKGSLMLMTRWFGNSLRATYRARKLPMRITTPFIWYLIRDQRITMWTGLYGLLASILGELKWGGGIFIAYIWWIMFSRFFLVLFIGLTRNVCYVIWVFLIYYNQIVGSLVKIYIMSHLYKQKWTRQKTTLKDAKSFFSDFYLYWSSNLEMATKILLFIIFTGYTVGFFDMEDLRNLLVTLNIYDLHGGE